MRFADYRVEVVPDTLFRLDGGAMFGVVPRTLWSKVCPPDEHNRIQLSCNCLFIETPTERILVETGMGDKWSAQEAGRYGITRERSLPESVRRLAGVEPEEISIVVNTHLHFDHAGGNTMLDEQGGVVPTFPNARYFVSRAEYEHAEAPHERDRASYLPENWRPLRESGQLELKEADYEVVPGLLMETIRGHSRTMQCVRLRRNGQTLFSFADLVPTRAHVPLAWIMGYDLYPVETLEAKKRLLPQAAREGWFCLFYHDPDAPLCRVVEEDGKLRAVGYEEKQDGFIPGRVRRNMPRQDKLLKQILHGTSDANVNFGELCRLLRKLGFDERMRGDHHIFTRDDVEEIINLQPKGAKAKVYQVRQVRYLILKYRIGDAHGSI